MKSRQYNFSRSAIGGFGEKNEFDGNDYDAYQQNLIRMVLLRHLLEFLLIGLRIKRMRAKSAVSSVVALAMFVSGCVSVGNDETNLKVGVSSEIWREYAFDWNERNLDTASVKGVIIKRKNYDQNGHLKTLIEFLSESGNYKKVTSFEGQEKVKTIETYYDQSEKAGVIEENDNDPKGNPTKKLISDIEDGERIMATSFEITNEYNDDGYLVRSTSLSSDDSSEAYITENSYNKGGEIEHSILKDNSGNVISEVRNRYNENGKLIYQKLSLHDVNKIKEIDIEYVDNLNRTETEKINGEIQRVSEFKYENGQLSEIVVNEAKRQRKKVIFVDRRYKE